MTAQTTEDPVAGFFCQQTFETDKPLDVSTELWRVYIFATPYGPQSVTVNEPKLLFVKRKDNGDSHRLILMNGECVYIPAGWLALHWKGRGEDPAADF